MIEPDTLSMTEIIRLQNRLQQELIRRFERKTLMVFSDIVGSTPYFARFGDVVGRQLHQMHADLLETSFAASQGRVVDTAGDGAFCVFPSVELGVRGVLEFHRAMARENAVRSRAHQLIVRIGLHWGTVLTDGAEVTGDAVHVAARVAKAARPGTVFLTRQVFQELAAGLRLYCRAAGRHELKGLAQPAELLELDWRDPAAFARRVLIEETGEVLDLPQQDLVAFGRLSEHEGRRANDVVLSHSAPERTRQISRWHFELRRSADVMLLRALSEGSTTIDGQPVAVGADVPVRTGSRIGVAAVLKLRLLSSAEALDDEQTNRTLMIPVDPDAG